MHFIAYIKQENNPDSEGKGYLCDSNQISSTTHRKVIDEDGSFTSSGKSRENKLNHRFWKGNDITEESVACLIKEMRRASGKKIHPT